MSTEDKVKDIIKDVVGIYPNLTDTSDKLDMDSIDEVEVIMKVEEEFAIHIPDDDAYTFVSVEDLVAYINKKIV